MVDQLSSFADEVTRVREKWKGSVLGGQANVPVWQERGRISPIRVNGWREPDDQVRNIADGDDRRGARDLGRRSSAEAKGEFSS